MNARSRVKTTAAQLANQAPEDAVDDLRDLLVDLVNDAHAADMLQTYDVATGNAEDGLPTVEVARTLVCEVAHTTHEDNQMTRLAVEHARNTSEIEPAPPDRYLADA